MDVYVYFGVTFSNVFFLQLVNPRKSPCKMLIVTVFLVISKRNYLLKTHKFLDI